METESSEHDIATVSRLRWRCRRGMRELDTLLERWLARRWPAADPFERAGFERLLDCEDDRLWNWCMGRAVPDDPELAAIVRQVVDLGDIPGASRDGSRLGG